MAAASSPTRQGSVALADLDHHVRPLTMAAERSLPLDPVWHDVLPQGLPRGATVSCTGPAARSCAFALAAAATQGGAWLAMVGLPGPGWAAMAELGVAIERVVAVQMSDRARSAECVACALDGFDVVLIGAAVPLSPADERRLAGRARERGTVLMGVAEGWASGRWVGPGSARFGRGAFAQGADLSITTRAPDWDGAGQGFGRLQARHLHVDLEGRRVPGRRRSAPLWLPSPAGTTVAGHSIAPVTSLERPGPGPQ